MIVTPVVPVLLWLALDRAFINKLWVEMVLAGAAQANEKSESKSRKAQRSMLLAHPDGPSVFHLRIPATMLGRNLCSRLAVLHAIPRLRYC